MIGIRSAVFSFNQHYPALRMGLGFLSGIVASSNSLYLLVPLIFLFLEKKYLSLIVFGAGYLYSSLLHVDPELEKPLRGSGIFHIKQVKRHQTPFQPLFVYEGTLRNFHSETLSLHRLPCHIYTRIKKNRPLASQDYFLSNVSLVEISPQRFILKTNRQSKWLPIEKTRSLAEWRFGIKEKARNLIKKRFQDKGVQELISGLITGHNESRMQAFQFRAIGLQHLLVISGFHFAILTISIAFVLRPFFPRKVLSMLLLLLLTFYFIYIGEAPSISRAWIGVLVFLGGMLLERKSAPLNALGVGLLAALISDPLIVLDIGFQLSFASTLGILLFYSPFESKLQQIFPKRPFKLIKTFSLFDQIGVAFSNYLRKVLALNGSVMVFTLPLLLTHFHNFPLIGLFYNLFFPLLFSFTIALLLIAIPFPFICPFLEGYTIFLLKLVSNAPKRLFFTLHLAIPHEVALILCLALLLWGVYLKWSASPIKEWELSI